jgi:EpsI family protein
MRHHIAVLVILIAVALGRFALAGQEAAPDSGPPVFEDLPREFFDYVQVGDDETVPPAIRRVLETQDIIIRSYAKRAPGPPPDELPVSLEAAQTGAIIPPVMQLTIVYAGQTRRSLHFPEVCLTGAGWETIGKEEVNLSMTEDAQRLLLAKGEQRQVVLFWFITGEKMTGSYFKNSYYWFSNQVMGGGRGSAMIRLGMTTAPGREDRSFAALEDLATKLVPGLKRWNTSLDEEEEDAA